MANVYLPVKDIRTNRFSRYVSYEKTRVKTQISYNYGETFQNLFMINSIGKQRTKNGTRLNFILKKIENPITKSEIRGVTSSKYAPGIIFANGSHLEDYLDYSSKNRHSYVSIDGGLSWMSIGQGVYDVRYFDLGSFVALIPFKKETEYILVSKNYGKTFIRVRINTYKVTIGKTYIFNI